MPPAIEGIQNERYARHESPYEHIHAVDFGTSLQGGPGLAPSGAETDDKRKKGSSASATNDKELRELLVKNDGRSLKEVATEVIQKERTPQAEKTKQLDITISGGGSYQTWWVTKIFVDEMSLWLAAMGGFLEHQPSEPPNTNLPSPPLENGNSMSSREHSRFSNLGADFSNDVSFAHRGSAVQANAAPDAK
ncbi:hypothetical protein B0A49_04863, partial [Cryomyces minteri]